MPSENHPIHCPFYSTYGIRLNEQTDMHVATRVIHNQYEGMLLEISLKPADIEQLEENGEDWATMFKYSSYLCEHHYEPAFLALTKALNYFNANGFPHAQSPIYNTFYMLIDVLNQGGFASFENTGLLQRGFNHTLEAPLFNAWGGIPDIQAMIATNEDYTSSLDRPNI